MPYLIFSYLIFIFCAYLTKSSEVISFQLNYFKTSEPLSSFLYTTMKLGEPVSNIYSYISSTKDLYSMIEVFKTLDINDLPPYYNINSSKTFKNISSVGKLVISEKDIYAQERFFFNLYNNKTKTYREIKIDEMDFVLGVRIFQSSGYIHFMNIGFPILKSSTIRNKFYFISQLKKRNIIENYDWFIYFDNNKKLGENEIFNLDDLYNMNPQLIIGCPPHYYKNDLFFKSQILTTYTEVEEWQLNFKDVYLNLNGQKVSIFTEDVEIYLDSLITYAPSYYLIIVQREFFSKYPQCKEEKGEETIFYCEKKDDFTVEILKSFPPLYFQHIDFNYVFELTYQDLFIEKDGKFLFLVVENYDNEIWRIGNSFLKKYQFVFNEDSKSIGFYSPDMPKEKEIDEEGEDKKNNKTNNDTDNESDKVNPDDKNQNETKNKTDDNKNDENNNGGINTKTVVFIVILSGIAFISIGMILGKIIFKKLKKKKRLNELDEDDYNNYENEKNQNIN